MPGASGKHQDSLVTRLFHRLLESRQRPTEDPDQPRIHPDRRSLVVAPDVRASIHGEGLALLHISTGRVFLCNRTGSRIWQCVVAGLSARAIADEISRDCGVGWERVLRHTSAFLFELERRGLVIPRVDSSC